MADQPARITQARPHRYALVAAAEVITHAGKIGKVPKNAGTLLDWQEKAWDFYDSVGEFRFGVSWSANALSRVNLVAARPPKAVGDEPVAIDLNVEEGSENAPTRDERRAAELVEMIAGGASGQGQLLAEFGEHLPVSGFGWMVAEPDLDDPTAVEYETWAVYAQDGLKFEGSGESQKVLVRESDGNGADAFRRAHPNALVVKCWRKHPRRPWEPDAPVRAVLGVLEIIELLTAHLTATGRSRLAGAGILAIPAEAEFPPPPPKQTADGEPDAEPTDQDRFDNFVEQLTDAMTTPIKDRDSAAAVVPYPIAIPGEFIDKLQHLAFSTPFDDKLSALLEQAVKRLALGLDMPPEVLTGMAGVNHWTAWQVEETAITLHVEPQAEIVCQALTAGFLRLALKAEGLDPDAAIVWYDTNDLTAPPDKSGNAIAAYDRRELSGAALRREGGFSDEDAPNEDEKRERILLDAAKGAPTLAPVMLAEAGYMDPSVADAAEDAKATEVGEGGGNPPEGDETEAEGGENGPPSRGDRPGAASQRALDGALLFFCDGIVDRAMERAGNRLRTKLGRKTGAPNPQAVEEGVDARVLHCTYDPTVFADLDELLAGAFDRVGERVAHLGVDADALTATLTAYCRGLLAAQHEHDLIRLASALDIDAFVGV